MWLEAATFNLTFITGIADKLASVLRPLPLAVFQHADRTIIFVNDRYCIGSSLQNDAPIVNADQGTILGQEQPALSSSDEINQEVSASFPPSQAAHLEVPNEVQRWRQSSSASNGCTLEPHFSRWIYDPATRNVPQKAHRLVRRFLSSGS